MTFGVDKAPKSYKWNWGSDPLQTKQAWADKLKACLNQPIPPPAETGAVALEAHPCPWTESIFTGPVEPLYITYLGGNLSCILSCLLTPNLKMQSHMASLLCWIKFPCFTWQCIQSNTHYIAVFIFPFIRDNSSFLIRLL